MYILSLICSDIVITVAPEITVSDQLHGVGPGANVTIKVGILCLKFSLNRETDKKPDRSQKLSKLQNFNSWMIKLNKTPILPNCQLQNGFFVKVYNYSVFGYIYFCVSFSQEKNSDSV